MSPAGELLAAEVLAGSRLALARSLTQVENNTPAGQAILAQLFPHTGRAHLIGVTGSPGAGKSSLVNQLARFYRQPGAGKPAQRVAIVAVDPSSPFTGGAILGDRIRMRDLSGDPGVFIRSMATRGSLGGLAAATAGVVQVFDAAGFDVILIETVGAGQSEVDIVRLAHTTLVVEAPGMGDDIQAIKAGILEIADLLVINKADRPGVENTERALRSMLELAHPARPKLNPLHHHQRYSLDRTPSEPEPAAPAGVLWIPPILRTVAPEGQGITEVTQAIERHRAHLRASGEWTRRDQERLQFELHAMLQEALMTQWAESSDPAVYQKIFSALVERQLAPHQAVEMLIHPDQPNRPA